MSNKTFNIAKGRIPAWLDATPGAAEVVLLKAVEADDALLDHDNMADLLAAPGNTECDFTNYLRKTALTATVTVDDTLNKTVSDLPDQTWTDAGGVLDNDILVAVFCQSNGAGDANLAPMTVNTWVRKPDGSDLTLEIPNGFHESVDA